MTLYYAHFNYSALADDNLYYGGSNSELFTNKAAAIKCGNYTRKTEKHIESFIICETEIKESFIPPKSEEEIEIDDFIEFSNTYDYLQENFKEYMNQYPTSTAEEIDAALEEFKIKRDYYISDLKYTL